MNFKKIFMLKALAVAALILITGCSTTSQIQKDVNNSNSSYSWLNLDTVKAGKFDTGKMWTFDFPPKHYFAEEYNFKPSDEWFNKVRMSALRFATYCSASFVSADGLVMTNNHCARESLTKVSKEGEDLGENGFYAQTLQDERKVPGLFVDQLVLIKDVTDEVQAAIDEGKTDEEKEANEKEIKNKIKDREEKATGLRIQIVTLYNGGKYSLYGYKRYNDVRLVFSPEHQLGFFGGDDDNFTYPRYALDCSFFRVYDENGKPLTTDNYFKWSPAGAVPGEAVFVVGNPGRTDRLKTVSQLEYMRDVQYPRIIDYLKNMIGVYENMIKENPEDKAKLENRILNFNNSLKAYSGMLKGLRDPILMAKKKDFEKKFQDKVRSNPELNKKYGDLWGKIADTRNEMRRYSEEVTALTIMPFNSSVYFQVAGDLVDLADELKLPEDQRSAAYKGSALDSTIQDIIPESINREANRKLLVDRLNELIDSFGYDNELVQKLTDGKPAQQAADNLIENSNLSSPAKIKALINKGADAILNSGDPFIYFVQHAQDMKLDIQQRLKKLSAEESEYSRMLGVALFKVYGTSIPPDATFTLRISDGVVKGYPYNGTVAPPYTTFYGLYNRYYAFGKKFPWDLPKKWLNPPADFKLETPFDFVSTNDIVGGNSGSPVINKDAQIVGLAFDGNIESLPGSFIYTTDVNRSVSVHSEGMLKAIKYIYGGKRLSDELMSGKIAEEAEPGMK